MEEPGRLQSMGLRRVRHKLSDFTFSFHFPALEKEMATHSSVLAWRIPGMGEPGGLPSMGSHRVGCDWSDLAAAAAVAFSVKYLSMHVYLRLACDYIEIVHFGQEYHRSDIVCSLVHHIRVFMILNVLLTMVSVSITWLKCLLVFFSFFFLVVMLLFSPM